MTVTPSDVYDSVPYLDHLEYIHENVTPIQAAAADSAYDFPLAHRVLEEHGIAFYVRPQPVHDRTQVELKRDAFRYDQEKDVYVCPNGKSLRKNGCTEATADCSGNIGRLVRFAGNVHYGRNA